MVLVILFVIFFFFIHNRDETKLQENFWAGMLCVVFFFLVISILAFPNGPFIRPHPAFWRLLFGLSVLYLMFLVFLMFQNHSTIMSIIHWFFPELKDFHIDQERVSTNCYQLKFVQYLHTHMLRSPNLRWRDPSC